MTAAHVTSTRCCPTEWTPARRPGGQRGVEAAGEDGEDWGRAAAGAAPNAVVHPAPKLVLPSGSDIGVPSSSGPRTLRQQPMWGSSV